MQSCENKDCHLATTKLESIENRMLGMEQKLDALATTLAALATTLTLSVGNNNSKADALACRLELFECKIGDSMSSLQERACGSLSRIEERVMTRKLHSLITLTVANSDTGIGTLAGGKFVWFDVNAFYQHPRITLFVVCVSSLRSLCSAS